MICFSDKGIVNKRFWVPQNRFASISFILIIVMVVIFRFSFWFMTLLIYGFEPCIKLERLFFTIELDCCKGHPLMMIENVGLEPLLCLPGAACCLNTSFSATPAGIEPAPPERQSGVLAVIRWSYKLFDPWSYLIRVSCTFLRTNEKPPVLSDKRRSQHHTLRFIWSSHGSRWAVRSQTSTWSGLIKAYTNKPFRFLSGRHNCPLKIKLTIFIFHSVCMDLQHCLSFPDLLSFFFTTLNIAPVVMAVILPVV